MINLSSHPDRKRVMSKYRLKTWVLFVFLISPLFSQTNDETFNSPAVILDEQISYTISSKCSAVLEVHKEIQVNNSRGEEYTSVNFYNSKYIKLESFDARIIDQKGEEIKKYKKDDLLKICGFGAYSLYDDVCNLVTSFSHVSYPYTVIIDYKEKYKSIYFWDDWYPQQGIPVKQAQYTLIVPDEFKLKYHTKHEIPEPEIIRENRKITYIWKMKDVPKFVEDDYIPYEYEERINMKFVPPKFKLDNYQFDACDWRTLGYNYLTMARDSYKLNEEQKLLMLDLKNTCSSQWEICRRLHQILIDKTRYVAIQIGIGGWLPTEACETYFRGYGDCKDLSFLYASMLRFVNITAHPVLIRTKSSGYLNPAQPTLNNFNHMILFAILDGDTAWIDPTCQSCEIGNLPDGDENVYCLAITDTAGCLLRSPVSNPNDNIINRRAEVTIGQKKSINVKIHFSTEGNPYTIVHYLINSGESEHLEKLLKSGLFGLSDKFRIDHIAPSNDGHKLGDILIKVEGQVKNAVHKIKGKYYLKLDFLETDIFHDEINLDDRKYPLDLQYPRTYRDSIVVNLPDGWTILEIPEEQLLESELGKLTITPEIDSNSVSIKKVFTNNNYFIEPEQFPELEAYRIKIKSSDKLHVVLSKDD